MVEYIEKRIAQHVKNGNNDSPSYRMECSYDAMRDLPQHSDRDIWNAAWNASMENAIYNSVNTMKLKQKGSSGSPSQPCSLRLLIEGKSYIIRQVDAHTKTRFEGKYKGFYIEVYLDENDYEPDQERYYIHVYNPEISLGTAYDGWAPEEVDNLKDAIKEALRGSQLLRAND